MIELMKNMEEPEQAEPVCDPEQAKQVCDPEQTEQVCDPEQTIALEETERFMSGYDPEQTAELIMGEENAAAEKDKAAEKDTAAEKDAVNEQDAAAEQDGAAEQDAAAEQDTAAEQNAGATEEPGRSEDLTGSGIFLFDGMEFRTPSELARYFQSYADDSRRALSRKVRQLYADKEHLLPEFEAWLIAIGKEKELNAWKRKIQGMR